MFAKILVPLDGSPLAEKALPCAIKLANIYKAQLVLLRVAELPAFTTDTSEHELLAVKTAEEYLDDIKQNICDSALDLYANSGRVEALAVYGEHEKDLIDLIAREKADLVVMTTHGRTGLARVVVGSMANRVLRNCNVPMVLIRPDSVDTSELISELMLEPSSVQDGIKHLVVTLDGTHESEAVLPTAIHFAEETGAEIQLVQVINPIIPVEYGVPISSYSYDLDKDLEERQNAGLVYLNKLQLKIEEQGVKCRSVVFVGNPAYEIINYANNCHASLIMMATHARGRFGQFLMGSVADEVVRKTHLPVMLVHTYPHVKSNKVEEADKLVGTI
ncbi:universal stress protein [Candidatus Chlorohelix sp.]|uniref:universal stress protein n=1 Tax=Candidatus Chlorohelix sp. TaxID=3139201 RepID=UPI0030609EA7